MEKLETAQRAEGNAAALLGQLQTMRRSIIQNLAQAGLWEEAVPYCERLLQAGGATPLDYHHAIVVALRAGAIADYRRFCAQWTRHAAETEPHGRLYDLNRMYALSNDSGMDLAQTLRAAQEKSINPPIRWFICHVCALVHYRLGNFDEALTWANESNTLGQSILANVLNYPVLALIHHRLGHEDLARRWLDRTRREWQRNSPLRTALESTSALPKTPKEFWSANWHDWPNFEILFHEATLTITGSPPTEWAYDHAHRGWLHSRLGQNDKAEDDFAKAVQANPSDALMWRERGRFYLTLGERDKAADDFKKAQELSGGNKDEPKK
jgi:tetratricopeptide (TPR) repeat protein